MDWLVWFFFESLPALAAVLFTANFVLLVYWRRSGRHRPLLVGVTLALALLIIQALVVTRREHARHVLTAIEKDVLASRRDHLAAAFAPSFTAGRMTRDEFLDYVGRQYHRVHVRQLNCSELRVKESRPDEFVVAVAYQGDITVGDYVGWVRTRWDVTFVRTAAGWQIARLQPRYVEGITDPTWADLGGE